MSIFPSFGWNGTPSAAAISESAQAATGKNPQFDYAKGEFVCTVTGRFALAEGIESLKVWAQKALLTARNRFLIYSSDYGNEAFELIGIDLPDEILFMELERLITETLVYDPRVSACTDFSFSREADRVLCDFVLVTPLGAEEAMSYTLEVS